MDVHVADHPLIAHKLTYLRDKRTDSPTFRRLAEELVTLLALEVSTYANRLPDDLTGRQVFILDPMLATGGTLVMAIDYLTAKGARDITAVCLLAAPEGIQHLEDELADSDIPVKVVLGTIDEKLNEKGYIVPGLGDAGDRLYGVV